MGRRDRVVKSLHPIVASTPSTIQTHLIRHFKKLPIFAPMQSAIINTQNESDQFVSSMNTTTAYTLTAVGVLAPKIKCQSENKKESYIFQSKSDSVNRNMTVKDSGGNQVCKVKNKGEHLLDLYLTTDSKDINVQFRDMIAFKKAVEKNSAKALKAASQSGDEDDDRFDPRQLTEIVAQDSQSVCWAFEFEGRIFQWTAPTEVGVSSPPGSEVLVCYSTSPGPATRIAKVSSSHTGASDKLIITNGSIVNVIDKSSLQILLLTSVLCLMELINDRSKELADFD
ncbi:hypothetical protein BGZ65_012935 [Modicella reniformis]|uniref:Uncharacterized protein n=1 Tax=Modicella reniformis TaxID=1440133 RepID=A0A9P6MLD9_9FUNG|nr:hypothetical protein BGZ65_012935 [Modicella reniformis]